MYPTYLKPNQKSLVKFMFLYAGCTPFMYTEMEARQSLDKGSRVAVWLGAEEQRKGTVLAVREDCEFNYELAVSVDEWDVVVCRRIMSAKMDILGEGEEFPNRRSGYYPMPNEIAHGVNDVWSEGCLHVTYDLCSVAMRYLKSGENRIWLERLYEVLVKKLDLETAGLRIMLVLLCLACFEIDLDGNDAKNKIIVKMSREIELTAESRKTLNVVLQVRGTECLTPTNISSTLYYWRIEKQLQDH